MLRQGSVSPLTNYRNGSVQVRRYDSFGGQEAQQCSDCHNYQPTTIGLAFGCFRTNKVANVLCIKRGPVRLSVMRAIKRADRPRRHHESGKDPPGLAIPAGLTLASDLPEKRPKIGPDDASDMKSSRLTSLTNPQISRTAKT
jgi:hypothetical protein